MTTATAPPTSAQELVQRSLAVMRAAQNGDPDALAELAAAAVRNGTALGHGRTVPPKRTTPPPAATLPTGMSAGQPWFMRPNGTPYYVRKMNGEHDDVAVLRHCRQENIPWLGYGMPGNGKTALFEAAFADGFEFVPGTGDTAVSDFVGGYVQQPGGGFLWVDGPLPRAMELGLPLLVDEIALIEPKVMAVGYSVMDGRSVLRITDNPDRGDVYSKPGFVLFGACNPNAPGANMSEALISRFELHTEISVDYKLMLKLGVPQPFITVCKNMQVKFNSDELGWFPQIREMLSFMKIRQNFGEETALSNVVSQAPENDRSQVAAILTASYGHAIKTLEIK